ncbi:MAG: TetR family transcriptional regulator [Comamonadaceae bacterium]|nr:MAG: TetR family transcriptional regulator [Comamonadaceae bacterium]
MVRRTKEEAFATRQRLLDAAELLFQAQGVSQTTLQQIAQKAGATRGAIYWHFKDKADLFNAMMERVTLPMEEGMRAAVSAGEHDPIALLERGIMDAFRLATADPQVRRVFEIASYKVEYTQEMSAVQERHHSGRQACIDDFEKALRLAAARARVKLNIPASTAALGLHAMISGLMQDWLLAPENFALLPAGRRLFRAYIRGLGLPISFGESAEGPPEAAAVRPSARDQP